MTPEVLTEFEDRGINLDTIILSREYRDVHPCGFPGKNRIGNGRLTSDATDFLQLR